MSQEKLDNLLSLRAKVESLNQPDRALLGLIDVRIAELQDMFAAMLIGLHESSKMIDDLWKLMQSKSIVSLGRKKREEWQMTMAAVQKVIKQRDRLHVLLNKERTFEENEEAKFLSDKITEFLGHFRGALQEVTPTETVTASKTIKLPMRSVLGAKENHWANLKRQ